MKQLFFLLVSFSLIACNSNSSSDGADSHTGHTTKTAGGNYCDSINKGLIAVDTLKGSPHRVAMATIGDNHVHIEYNSPGVKDRVIWGGLVAYDKVWVTGAHKATTVKVDKDIHINGTKVAAGKYAIFTIPGKEQWQFILNTRHDQHLADDYDEKEDVLRFAVTPQANEMVQRLTYAVSEKSTTEGEITISWEKIKLVIPFTL